MAWGVDEDDSFVPIHGVAQQQGCDPRLFCQQWTDSPALANGQQAWTDADIAMALMAAIHGDEHITSLVIQPLLEEVGPRADFMTFVIGLHRIQ